MTFMPKRGVAIAIAGLPVFFGLRWLGGQAMGSETDIEHIAIWATLMAFTAGLVATFSKRWPA